MKPDQNLYRPNRRRIIWSKTYSEESFTPDYVYVHGDTTTTMAVQVLLGFILEQLFVM